MRKDLLEWLSAYVGQHVETASMRHSHDDRLDAEFARFVNNRLHSGDEHFAALQTETLLRRPFAGEESFESEYR